MGTKQFKTDSGIFKYGDDVFIYVEYEGILEGIIKGVNNDIKPFLYIVECTKANNIVETYNVSQLHAFKSSREANSYISMCARDYFIDMCDKLGLDASSVKVRLNAFVGKPKYSKAQIKALVGKEVEVVLDNGQKLEGILTYCRYYKAKDGVISENFYYLNTLNSRKYITFKVEDILKIKEKV